MADEYKESFLGLAGIACSNLYTIHSNIGAKITTTSRTLQNHEIVTVKDDHVFRALSYQAKAP